VPGSKLLGEERTPAEPPKQVAFNWGVGVMLSALNAAAEADAKFQPWLREYADAIEVYWNPAPPVAGYDVWPVPKPADRYYDDNAWMVMSLVETYERLKDRKYLDRAQKSLEFVLSGEDDKLGGGIYWRESDKASKNTCSNAPSVAAMLSVIRHTRDKAMLARAQNIYAWTKKNLQDPSDKLMWDALSLDGKLDKTKWSYNTGLMIRAAKGLYAETRDAAYLRDAQEMEVAAIRHWTPEPTKGARCDAKFVHLLFEAYAFEPVNQAGLKARDEALRFVRENVRDSQGRFGHRWEVPAKGDWGKFSLIDQASAARAFLEASQTP
jgi:rhamnogalacturonyl hydrolase YesR